MSLTRIVVNAGFVAAVCFALCLAIIYRWHWPAFLAYIPAYFGVIFLIVALRFVPRADYFTFKDHWNRPLFTIVREKDQADECDAFVCALLDRIEHRESAADDQPTTHKTERNKLPRPSAVRVDGHDDAPAAAATSRWKVALVSGAVSICYPPLAYAFSDYALEPVLVVVVSSTIGVFATFLSWQAKEPRRLWSLLGAALCMLPILFPYGF